MKTTARNVLITLLAMLAGQVYAQDGGHLSIETVVQKEEVHDRRSRQIDRLNWSMQKRLFPAMR